MRGGKTMRRPTLLFSLFGLMAIAAMAISESPRSAITSCPTESCPRPPSSSIAAQATEAAPVAQAARARAARGMPEVATRERPSPAPVLCWLVKSAVFSR